MTFARNRFGLMALVLGFLVCHVPSVFAQSSEGNVSPAVSGYCCIPQSFGSECTLPNVGGSFSREEDCLDNDTLRIAEDPDGINYYKGEAFDLNRNQCNYFCGLQHTFYYCVNRNRSIDDQGGPACLQTGTADPRFTTEVVAQERGYLEQSSCLESCPANDCSSCARVNEIMDQQIPAHDPEERERFCNLYAPNCVPTLPEENGTDRVSCEQAPSCSRQLTACCDLRNYNSANADDDLQLYAGYSDGFTPTAGNSSSDEGSAVWTLLDPTNEDRPRNLQWGIAGVRQCEARNNACTEDAQCPSGSCVNNLCTSHVIKFEDLEATANDCRLQYGACCNTTEHWYIDDAGNEIIIPRGFLVAEAHDMPLPASLAGIMSDPIAHRVTLAQFQLSCSQSGLEVESTVSRPGPLTSEGIADFLYDLSRCQLPTDQPSSSPTEPPLDPGPCELCGAPDMQMSQGVCEFRGGQYCTWSDGGCRPGPLCTPSSSPAVAKYYQYCERRPQRRTTPLVPPDTHQPNMCGVYNPDDNVQRRDLQYNTIVFATGPGGTPTAACSGLCEGLPDIVAACDVTTGRCISPATSGQCDAARLPWFNINPDGSSACTDICSQL